MTTKEVPIEAHCSAVLQTGITAPKSPRTTELITQQSVTLVSSPAAVSETSDTLDHTKWSEDAWIALTRSLVRYPGPHSQMFKSRQRQAFIELFAKRSREGTAIKWLKFHTSYIFAYAFEQSEFPAPPGAFEEGERPGRMVGGPLGRALKCIMERGRGGSWPYRRCAYDILMSKLGDPCAPASFVESTLKDHRTALTRKAGEESEAEEQTLLEVEEMIAVICKRVFGRKHFNHRDPIPSIRACQENGLSNAGALGELISGFDKEYTFLPENDTLFAMFEVDGEVRELRFIDMNMRTSLFQDWVDRCWKSRLGQPLNATPVPILEPLKVRVITKGEAAEYYRAIELQKLMHGALRTHPVFQCIGHPIEDTDWAQTFRSQAELGEDEFYVSGDYKAATDNLRPDLSEWTWKCICSNVHLGWNAGIPLSATPYYELGLKALTGHVLHYKNECVPQSWGQLMGSPMSFPILCIVNAAATLVALKQEYGPNVRLRVNGDDIAFIADPVIYARWKEVTHLCGLDFSIGKNYTSRQFIIMNSELRRAPKSVKQVSSHQEDGMEEDPEHEGSLRPKVVESMVPKPWKFEGFVNQCLLYNTIKKGMDATKPKDTYWTDLSSISSEMIRGIPPKDQWRLYGIFFKTYNTVIREAPKMANKWFPKSLGGMGLTLPQKFGDWSPKKANQSALVDTATGVESLKVLDTPSDRLLQQQKVAAYLACNPRQRMKRVSQKRELFGPLDTLFKDIRTMSDAQVPAVLHKKLRNRECTPIMGGQTLLGYLLGVSALAGGEYDSDGGVWVPGPIGGQKPEGTSARHANTAAILRQSYSQWLGIKAQAHSLTPMRIDHILGYSEHLEMSSRIEVMREFATSRLMD